MTGSDEEACRDHQLSLSCSSISATVYDVTQNPHRSRLHRRLQNDLLVLVVSRVLIDAHACRLITRQASAYVTQFLGYWGDWSGIRGRPVSNDWLFYYCLLEGEPVHEQLHRLWNYLYACFHHDSGCYVFHWPFHVLRSFIHQVPSARFWVERTVWTHR